MLVGGGSVINGAYPVYFLSMKEPIVSFDHSFMTVIPSHFCRESPFAPFYDENMAEAVLLYLFKMVFPASI